MPPGPDDEAVPLAPEDALDLHAFAPREVPEVVLSYLEAAREAGLRQVRVIHGRGAGVQRARVIALLRTLPWVVEVREATPDLGGWGATIVVLAAAEPVRTR